MQTILIAGCSSGYGLATARLFHAQGWNVIATMRTPREDVLPQSNRLRVPALDVTKSESIVAVLEASGRIDVLVNNVGIGVVGAFEATPLSHIRKVFETNTFGAMAMTQAVIPHMRERRDFQHHVKHNLGTLPVGGSLHCEQAGHRGLHRFAGSRAWAFQHSCEAGRTRIRSDDEVHAEYRGSR